MRMHAPRAANVELTRDIDRREPISSSEHSRAPIYSYNQIVIIISAIASVSVSMITSIRDGMVGTLTWMKIGTV